MTNQTPAPRVERCTTAQILALRLAVLRDGTPSQVANYSEDDLPGAIHLAVRDNGESGGEVVATSTWIPRRYPYDESVPPISAVQLKGMAVAKRLQGTGVGAILLAAGIEHARSIGATCVWARARDSALYFYERHGFKTIGAQFIDEATGMDHHVVVTWLQ